MRKTLCLSFAMLALSAGMTNVTQAAEEEFYGVLESRPQGNLGTWVVAGRKLEVTKATELEEKHGPLVVGACVEVEIEDGVVEEIETKRKEKCSK